MSPKPDVSEERKEQITEAATKVFAEQGFDKARMDDIATEANLSKGTLYLYFKSKDAIIKDLLERLFEREIAGLRVLVDAPYPASEKLRLFAEKMIGGLTATQFSMLFRLFQVPGPISQNALGRLVAMDAATTKGVVSRLQAQELITAERDTEDKRRYMLRSTAKGRALIQEALPVVMGITEATLAPLSKRESETFLRLLAKLC